MFIILSLQRRTAVCRSSVRSPITYIEWQYLLLISIYSSSASRPAHWAAPCSHQGSLAPAEVWHPQVTGVSVKVRKVEGSIGPSGHVIHVASTHPPFRLCKNVSSLQLFNFPSRPQTSAKSHKEIFRFTTWQLRLKRVAGAGLVKNRAKAMFRMVLPSPQCEETAVAEEMQKETRNGGPWCLPCPRASRIHRITRICSWGTPFM